jgi:hypothetical protein
VARDEDDDAPAKKGMDPLKAYCLVLGFLVVVLGVLWIKLGGDRDDYEAANRRAEQLLTGKGLTRVPDGPPPSIPDIAYEVERYVETYKATAGEGGANVSGIPLEMMKNYASSSGMTQSHSGGGSVDVNRNRGYQTRTNDFEYEPTTLRNLLTLVYNVESKGRYRVQEITWRLDDPKKANAAPPYWFIAKPRIKVAVRTPIQREEK